MVKWGYCWFAFVFVCSLLKGTLTVVVIAVIHHPGAAGGDTNVHPVKSLLVIIICHLFP